ncbi:hypothetical protein AHAS_Ahas14G0210700 [Arachis hypogaea]
MASLSMPSVSEQNRDDNNNKNNSISNKFLLPRKPARQPNPIIYRRLRRGSVAARISGKQTEYPTNKELLRTIAYLRNATAVFYEPDRMLPYNKAYIHDDDDDDEEGVTEDDEKHNFLPNDEKRKQELDKSMQKPNKNSGYNLTRKQTRKECDVSSSSTSHVVVNLKDTSRISDRSQGLTKKSFRKPFAIRKHKKQLKDTTELVSSIYKVLTGDNMDRNVHSELCIHSDGGLVFGI